MLVFINAAAPAPNHVATQIIKQRHSLIHSRFISAMECVQRYPVRAFDHDWLIVYDKQKMAFWIGRYTPLSIECLCILCPVFGWRLLSSFQDHLTQANTLRSFGNQA